MSHEFLRMQKLSGVITEGQYNQKIEELNSQTLNENNIKGVEAFLKSKGYKIEKVNGSTEAKERETEFAAGSQISQDPDAAKKNNKAFITDDDLIHDGIKSFMVFVPRYSPQGKENTPLKDEIKKKFGTKNASTGTFTISLIIPSESNVSETLNENVVGVGGTMNPYPTKKKEVYESAFSRFLGEEEVEEAGNYYEEPTHEGEEKDDADKKALDKKEDELDEKDMETETLKEKIKHHADAIKNIKKELEDLTKDLGEDEEDEEKEKKEEVDEALDMAEEALKKNREEEDLSEESKKEKDKEGDMRDDGGESVETKRTEKMRDDM